MNEQEHNLINIGRLETWHRISRLLDVNIHSKVQQEELQDLVQNEIQKLRDEMHKFREYKSSKNKKVKA